MQNIIIILNVLTAISLIGIILLQQGKGAEMGASFGGGASQTVFGSQGSGSFFTKMTALLALVFFATSVSLAIMAKNNAADLAPVPVLEQADGLAEEAVNIEGSTDTESATAEKQNDGLAEDVESLSESASNLEEKAEGLAEDVESTLEEAEGLADPDK